MHTLKSVELLIHLPYRVNPDVLDFTIPGTVGPRPNHGLSLAVQDSLSSEYRFAVKLPWGVGKLATRNFLQALPFHPTGHAPAYQEQIHALQNGFSLDIEIKHKFKN